MTADAQQATPADEGARMRLMAAHANDTADAAIEQVRAVEAERDALAETLRLRGIDIVELGAQINGLMRERDAATARADRLAEALRRICAPKYGLQGLIEDNASEADYTRYWRNMASRFGSIARAALAQEVPK